MKATADNKFNELRQSPQMQAISKKLNDKLDASSVANNPELKDSYIEIAKNLHFTAYQKQIARFIDPDYQKAPEKERQEHIEAYRTTTTALRKTLKSSEAEENPSLKVFKGIVTDFVDLFDKQTTQKDGKFHLSDQASKICAQSKGFFVDLQNEFRSLEEGTEKSLKDCQRSISNLSKTYPEIKDCFKTATKVIAEEAMKALDYDDKSFLIKNGMQIAGGVIAAAGNPGSLAILTNPYVLIGILAAAAIFGILGKLFGGKKGDKSSNVNMGDEKLTEEQKDDLSDFISMLIGYNKEDEQEKKIEPEATKATTVSGEAVKDLYDDIREELSELRKEMQGLKAELQSTKAELSNLNATNQNPEEKLQASTPEEQATNQTREEQEISPTIKEKAPAKTLEEKLQTSAPEEQKEVKSRMDSLGIDLPNRLPKSADAENQKETKSRMDSLGIDLPTKTRQQSDTSWLERIEERRKAATANQNKEEGARQ